MSVLSPTDCLRRLVAGLIVALALVPAGARAQEIQLSGGNDADGQIIASPAASDIALDGILDEPAWEGAAAISEFIQYEPIEGDPATLPSEVRVLYGTSSLYIGAVLYDDDPSAIEAALGRRDEYNRADWFLVSIDSYLDRKTAYTFAVNAAGVQFDAIQTSGRRGNDNEDGPDGDASWDAIWFASPRITHEGWVVEMRIPYSMLRFAETREQTWGIHFMRDVPRLGERTEWPHVPRIERTNLVAQFGHLTGLVDVKPRRNIQVSPYTVSRLQRNEDPNDTGTVVGSGDIEVGGDLKIGLGPNVTLDATINPDFGQVESDPAELNLTAFETFFQERRPFFLEGMQIYDFDVGPARLPYTRRIGGQAPIIAATKLSGRTDGGFSFGVLGATTGERFSPARNYGVARVSQQIGDYSRLGAIVTGFDAPIVFGEGRRRSTFAGADYDFRFGNNGYNVEGFAGFTTSWATEDGLDAQRGLGGKVLFRKRNGVVTGFTGIEGFDDTFLLNDVGLLRQNNYLAVPLRLQYNINKGQPFGPFLRASIGDFGMQQFSVSDGLDLGQRHSISAEGTLRGFQQVQLGLTLENVFGGYDIYETRGLLPWVKPFQVGVEGEFVTDARRSWFVEPEGAVLFDENGGVTYGAGLRGEWNVGSRLMLSGNVEAEWEDDVVAWASNETFLRTVDGWVIGTRSLGPDVLDNSEFALVDDQEEVAAVLAGVTPYARDTYFTSIFGARDTRSVDITVRSTVTFTPTLSIQLYSQLFMARGRYREFSLLEDRDTLVPFDTFPKRNEFAFSNLQSNMVLRWEYRPGSTLFLVWTHGRSSDNVLNPLAPWGVSPYERRLDGQVADTFDIIPTNVFLVKLNYTFLY